MRASRKSIYLPGDSFPDDEYVRRTLEHRLGITLELIEDRKPEEPPARLHRLRRYFEAFPDVTFTLFGRSSGCRVVTQMATDPEFAPRIESVVALSYPFHRPCWPDQPERYAHLHQVRSRCLIIQGRTDPYNGDREVTAYGLSNTTTVHHVPCDHNMWLEPPLWDLLGATIGAFVGDRVLADLRRGGPALPRLCA